MPLKFKLRKNEETGKNQEETLKTSSWIQEIFIKEASRKPRIILAESQDLVTLSKIDTNTFVNLLKILTRFGSVRFETF